MKTSKSLMIVFLLSLFSVASCEYNDGSAEQAGESVDNAYQDAENAVEDACEDVKEGVNADDTDC